MAEYLDPVRYLGNMANHQKMYDFERDILRVKNPLNEDFTFIYDMMPITVPAGGTKDMERYLARHYVKEMIGHIYNQINADRMEKAHEAFKRNHPDVIDDPYLLNEQIYLKLPRSDNPEFQKKVVADCIVGVVAKYGTNRQIPRAAQTGKLDPNTPLFQTLIDGFKSLVDEKPVAQTATVPSQAVSPTQQLG